MTQETRKKLSRLELRKLKDEIINNIKQSKNFKEVGDIMNIAPSTIRCFCIRNNIDYSHFDSQNHDIPINTKYNLLTVLRKTDKRKKEGFLYECLCDCGNICYIPGYPIKSGHTKSCGCKIKASGKNSPLFKGYESITSNFWKSILRCAEIRGITVSITIEDAWNKFIQQNGHCALTGIKLVFAKTCKLENQGYTTASLDRIDSNKGYDIDNIQWLHKDVNKMKWDFTQEQVIQYAHMICKLHPSP